AAGASRGPARGPPARPVRRARPTMPTRTPWWRRPTTRTTTRTRSVAAEHVVPVGELPCRPQVALPHHDLTAEGAHLFGTLVDALALDGHDPALAVGGLALLDHLGHRV